MSPYAKTDARKRLGAAGVDALIATTLAVIAMTLGNVLYVGLSAGYLLLPDAMGGQSIGKLLLGLVVVELESGRPASWRGSVRRNLLVLLPGANVAAVFLEVRTILADSPYHTALGADPAADTARPPDLPAVSQH